MHGHGDTPEKPSPAEKATPRAGRGRPRRYEAPKSLRHLPLERRLDDLSPSVRAMLDAGRRILTERGFRALTLESVAFEAGASKSTLVEQFGNRTGYLTMLFDSLMQDEGARLGEELQRAPGGIDDVERRIGSLAMLYQDVQATRAYFEIAANAMHQEDLRLRLAELFEWYRSMRLEMLRDFEGADVCSQQELDELAALLDAAEDGLALRRCLNPGFDMESVLSRLGNLVATYLREKTAQTPPGLDQEE